MVALTSTAVHAGGVVVNRSSVSFENGQSTVRPGTAIRLRFTAQQYMYGSDKYGYVALAVMPANESIDKASATATESWMIFGALASKPVTRDTQGDQDNEAALDYTLEFEAPAKPGKYKVVIGAVPVFASERYPVADRMRHSFQPIPWTRFEFLDAVRRYGSSAGLVATFTVSPAATPSSESLTLYLRLNGEVPHLAKGIGGIQKKPLTFSWKVGPEFKSSGGKLQYRYLLKPGDDDYGIWTTAEEVSYSFLVKGIHEFRVQARYVTNSKEVTSQPATYQFNVPKEHLSEPQLKQPFGPIAASPVVSLKDVYGTSRALLVGTWTFRDKHFPQFDEAKISADVQAMSDALKRNGFEVSVLKAPQVSRDDIVSAIAALVSKVRRNDRVLVYFSTHGFADPNSPSDGYLATSDCDFDKPEVRCFKLRDLESYAKKALDSQNARQVLFAIDSCFSGLGVVLKAASTQPAVDLTQLGTPKGAFMLTAGMANQSAQIDSKLGMSTFTHYLAEGLNGKGDLMKNGVMTLTQLFVYLQWEVIKQTKAEQIPMMGRISGDGEMLFWPVEK